MDTISQIVKNLAVIVLLTAFLDMLLPSSNMQKFIKIIMGLFVIVTILSPFATLINKEANFEEVLAWSSPVTEGDLNKIMAKGTEIANVNHELAFTSYKGKLEKQMAVLVKLIDGVEETEINLGLDANSVKQDITAVLVKISLQQEEKSEFQIKPIDPISVEIKSPAQQEAAKEVKEASPNKAAIEREVKDLLASYFDIPKSIITVEWGAL